VIKYRKEYSVNEKIGEDHWKLLEVFDNYDDAEEFHCAMELEYPNRIFVKTGGRIKER
jgi:hypothetical protein